MYSKQILKISWNIATEPKLYRELASNPYSTHSLQIISERFPDVNLSDVIKAIALAEPESRYDRGFKQLETGIQNEELHNQKVDCVEINKSLEHFWRKYLKQFRKSPNELCYNDLFLVAFGTNDLAKIEQRFTQDQRLNIKLSIIDLIENSKGYKAYLRFPDRSMMSTAFTVLLVTLLIMSSIYLSMQKISKSNKNVKYQEGEYRILGMDIQKESKELPVRLKIPSINVDAKIQRVGVSPNGEMEVSSDPADVGWFELGPRPGEIGSAVIGGHFNGKGGDDGVFVNLHKLKQGDKLFIEDKNGTLTTFVVRENRIFYPGFANEVFTSNNTPQLNLITCDGVWDNKIRSYSKRLVVFADIAR